MPPNTIYVGRPTKWGNPFNWLEFNVVGAPNKRQKAVEWYQFWLNGDLDMFRDERDQILEDLHELTGKNLACWCPLEQSCHADILLKLANGGQNETR